MPGLALTVNSQRSRPSGSGSPENCGRCALLRKRAGGHAVFGKALLAFGGEFGQGVARFVQCLQFTAEGCGMRVQFRRGQVMAAREVVQRGQVCIGLCIALGVEVEILRVA
jgi:hypothetical protein